VLGDVVEGCSGLVVVALVVQRGEPYFWMKL
jgi:hypothetical protein